MKIKVCGMRDADNIRDLSLLHPDYMGLIFYPQSKRYVNPKSEQLVAGISPSIKKTGVFVNASVDEIMQRVLAFRLDAVQLHGDETPPFCKQISNSGLEVIKAFGIDHTFSFDILDSYIDVVDYFLFDTKTPGYGGSGKAFDWQILDHYRLKTPYFISGGLNPANIDGMLERKDERFFGVDLNSGFEIAPALKNITELQKAFNLLRP